VFSPGSEPVELSVFDIYGRQVYKTRGDVKQNFQFGETLAGGTYFVEAVQGAKRSMLKLIKQ
jgi:hypothetical protein